VDADKVKATHKDIVFKIKLSKTEDQAVNLPAHRAGLLMAIGILFYWSQPGAWGSLFKKRKVRSADAALHGAFGCRQTSYEKGPASELHG